MLDTVVKERGQYTMYNLLKYLAKFIRISPHSEYLYHVINVQEGSVYLHTKDTKVIANDVYSKGLEDGSYRIKMMQKTQLKLCKTNYPTVWENICSMHEECMATAKHRIMVYIPPAADSHHKQMAVAEVFAEIQRCLTPSRTLQWQHVLRALTARAGEATAKDRFAYEFLIPQEPKQVALYVSNIIYLFPVQTVQEGGTLRIVCEDVSHEL